MRTYRTVDVFTDTPFAGNPLAVVEDASGLADAQMLLIAREFGYSETVFVLPPEIPSNTARLRIFTPTTELPFAGHPTIGAAAILAFGRQSVRLEENIGVVHVEVYSSDADVAYAELTAPQLPLLGPPPPPSDVLAGMLGLLSEEIARSPQCYSAGVPFVFVELTSATALARISFNVEHWRTHLAGHWAPQLYAFHVSPTKAGMDVCARMFSPAFGVLEDTGTGAAAVALAAVLTRLDASPHAGSLRYSITQGTALGRPSRLSGTAELSGAVLREVRVGGHVVPISSGKIADSSTATPGGLGGPTESVQFAGQHHT